jgi:hypothetical protein
MMCGQSLCDETQAMAYFEMTIQPSLDIYEVVSYQLMGFSDDPLLLRFAVEVKDSRSWYPILIHSDKTMIQEIDYEQ